VVSTLLCPLMRQLVDAGMSPNMKMTTRHAIRLSDSKHSLQTSDQAAECAAMYCANAAGFLVCMKTVPGPLVMLASRSSCCNTTEDSPVNLHTKPSPELILLMMPPLAIRSRMYLQFHATRCPLSMMYFSPSRSYSKVNHSVLSGRVGDTLTSFRIIAPILMIQHIPTPLILYTNKPSPENIALLKLWLL